MIISAYNKKVLGVSTQVKETDYQYLKRTIGPGTWVYEILETEDKTWDKMRTQLTDCKTDSERYAWIDSYKNRFKT